MLDTSQVVKEPGAVAQADAGLRAAEEMQLVPVYEGKFFGAFDHRFAGIETGRLVEYSAAQKTSPTQFSSPRFYLPRATPLLKLSKYGWNREWVLVYSRKVNRNNARTISAAVLPLCGAVDTCPTLLFHGADLAFKAAAALTLLNSFLFDYLIRSRLSGFTIGADHLSSMAIPDYELLRHAPLTALILPRALAGC